MCNSAFTSPFAYSFEISLWFDRINKGKNDCYVVDWVLRTHKCYFVQPVHQGHNLLLARHTRPIRLANWPYSWKATAVLIALSYWESAPTATSHAIGPITWRGGRTGLVVRPLPVDRHQWQHLTSFLFSHQWFSFLILFKSSQQWFFFRILLNLHNSGSPF